MKKGCLFHDAEVSILSLNFNTLTIYNSSGGIISQPLITNSGGVFEFYVKDDIGVPSGANGHYAWDKEYRIAWEKDDKIGFIQGDALFGRYAQVDETDSSSTRINKAIE
jgi:hypothetical protein